MSNAQSRRLSGRSLALAIVIGVAAALAWLFVQLLVWGEARHGVSGGVVGAIAASAALRASRKPTKKEDQTEGV